MTDIEKHQALERYLSWKDHPYTKMVIDYFNGRLAATHLNAEHALDKSIALDHINEARVIREVILTLQQPLGQPVTTNIE